MPIDPAKEGTAHFALDPDDPSLGCIFAADGSRSALLSSQAQAEICIALFVEFGYLSPEERAAIECEIHQSPLPPHDDENDFKMEKGCEVLCDMMLAARSDPSPDLYPWEIGSDEAVEDSFQLVSRRPIHANASCE